MYSNNLNFDKTVFSLHRRSNASESYRDSCNSVEVASVHYCQQLHNFKHNLISTDYLTPQLLEAGV